MQLRVPQADRRTPKPAYRLGRRWAHLVLAFGLASLVGTADLGAGTSREDKRSEDEVKAGFLYRFLFFVEWPPNEGLADDSLALCIAGESSLIDAFTDVEGQAVEGRKLIVAHLEGDAEPESLRACDLLFISASLADQTGDILRSLEGYPVLSVSEVKGFAREGGMINLITRENRLGFEINRGAAELVGIKLRSKLLRLADRFVEGRNGR